MKTETLLNDDVEIVDLEELAAKGVEISKHTPDQKRKYRIRIDREHYLVDVPCMTGRELLELASKRPEQYQIFQKLRGGAVEEIEADGKADFTTPGIERFFTLPLAAFCSIKSALFPCLPTKSDYQTVFPGRRTS